MTTLSHEAMLDIANKLIRAHDLASETGDWLFFVDELYDVNCIYTCEYGGTMRVVANGIDDIKATHYGRDMNHGWEGWTFPYLGVYVGSDQRLITHWMNRGPGKRPDGTFFETPAVSYLTLGDNGKIIQQLDLFDLAHQMKLCDDLEDAGLLSADLKANWVIPMKQKLQEQLARNT